MKYLVASLSAIIPLMILLGCEPTEQTHAQILGGQLKQLYRQWINDGRRADFQPTNYITSNTAEFFVFTNSVTANGTRFHCRFGVRSPGRFEKPGTLAITDREVILWVGDDGKVILEPDVKEWLSK